MTQLSQKELKGITTLGAVIAVVGLVLFVVFRGAYQPQEFWSIYKVAASGTGLMMLIFGLFWTGLGLIHLKTRVFDEGRKMDADRLVILIAAVGAAVVVALLVTLPKLPSTPTNKLPADQKQRVTLVTRERGFKAVVTGIIVACGFAVLSGPCRRFMRR